MTKKLMFITAFLAVANLGFAGALSEGSKELSLNGNVDFDSALGTQANAQLGLGFFVADGLSVGPFGSVLYNDLVTVVQLGASAEYNFISESAFTPFVGAGIAWINGDLEDGGDEQGGLASARAGVKYFMTESWALSISVVYDKATEDVFAEDDEDDLSDDNLSLDIGIRTFF
jgi:hypothetical protein